MRLPLCVSRRGSSSLQQERFRVRQRRRRRLVMESLEARRLLAADFVAANFADNLDQVLADVDTEINGAEVLQKSIPLVGQNLQNSAATSFFADLRTAIAGVLDGTENTAALIEADLETALSGIGDADDVSIDNVSADKVAFDITFTHSLASESLSFDLGIPALGLDVSAMADVSLEFIVNLRVGVDTDSFFFETSTSSDEIQLNLDVDLSGLTSSSPAQAQLGLLKLVMFDQPGNPSTLGSGAGFRIDVTGAPGSLGFDTTFDAMADINLRLETDLSEISDFLPNLAADLDIDWEFNAASTSEATADFGDPPDVSFAVELEAESFFTTFVDPILDPVARIIDPVRPVVQLLKHPIPGFNDLGPLRSLIDGDLGNNDGTANLLDFVKIVAPGADLSFIDVLAAFDELVMLREQVAATGFLPLGSFDFGSVNLLDGTDPSTLSFGTDLPFAPNDVIAEFESADSGAGGFFSQSNASTLDNSGSAGGGLTFDIIEDPTQAFGLFLDQDAQLFTWNLPELNFSGGFSKSIPVFPGLEIGGGGDFGVTVGLAFGYDTVGLRNFINGGAVEDIFLDGFFIPTTEEVIRLDASVFFEGQAGQGLIGEARAGIGTGMDGIRFTLADDTPADGLRLSELGGLFGSGPFCFFDIEGEIVAFLEGELKIGIETDFISATKTIAKKRFAEATIFPISHSCSEDGATDAEQNAFASSLAEVLPDGTLQLNMGPFAGNRGGIDNNDGDEEFVVTHVDGEAGSETVNVSAFGFNHTYEGVVSVVADAGVGDDRITFAEIRSPIHAIGGIGDDVIDSSTSPGAATFEGGSGADILTSGEGDDVLRGGEGDDVINSGDGNDYVYGDAGNDQLDGQGGDDHVFGGAGNDIVVGSEGDDQLYGGEGNDELLGNEGNDFLFGDSGSDSLFGGLGADTIQGGDDSDEIVWLHDDASGEHDGNDVIDGGAGTDRVVVQTSAEAETFEAISVIAHLNFSRTSADPFTLDIVDVEVFGANFGAGDDVIEADDLTETDLRFMHLNLGDDSDDDTVIVNGQNSDDDVTATGEFVGGQDVVDVVGFSPQYQIFQAESDDDTLVIKGREGDDTIHAASGTESFIQITLDGGPGNDFLSADATLLGGAGDDVLQGIPGGNDTFDGGDGFDTILVEGTPDDDVIDVKQTAAGTIEVTVNGTTDTESISNVEQVRIAAGAGNDFVGVSVSHSLNATAASSLRFDIQGGDSNTGDRLVVKDDGIGNLVIHREGPDQRSGSINVGPLAPVVYTDIENVDVVPFNSNSGATGSDLLGRLLVVDTDPLEQNDDRANATDLDALAGLAVKPSIDPPGVLDPFNFGSDLAGDEDWYRFTAEEAGPFLLTADFEAIAQLDNGEPGLPGDGLLTLEVYDADGNLIPKEPTDEDWQHSVGLAIGNEYFVRVYGSSTNSLNVYDVTVTDLDILGPQVLDVFLPVDTEYELFDPKASTDGPTPAVDRITITFTDRPERLEEFVYPAVNESLATILGNYHLMGDHSGEILIKDILFDDFTVAGNGELAVKTNVTLVFDELLPDDRYTLTISDSITDGAGNALDGESQANAPFEESTLKDTLFPSGDGTPGSSFAARFTVDSRPEFATYGAGTVYSDINGNFVFDTAGKDNDRTNRDLIFHTPELTGYAFFNGDFAPAQAASSSGFDKLGAFGVNAAGNYEFRLDFDHDGVLNFISVSDVGDSAAPLAGDFDPTKPGDEIGLFDGSRWILDTNGDNQIDMGVDTVIPTSMRGLPIVGDFNGDGSDDLAVFDSAANKFHFDTNRDGTANSTIHFGFSGFTDHPIAGDFNLDGIDDIGLWVPGRQGQLPKDVAEWFLLLSDRQDADPANVFDAFSPAPLGNDVLAQFGDDSALPLFGNLDPPVTGGVPSDPRELVATWQNESNPLDINRNGHVTPHDAVLLVNYQLRVGAGLLPIPSDDDLANMVFYDVNGDFFATLADIAPVIAHLNLQAAGGEAEASSAGEPAGDSRTQLALPEVVTPANQLPATFVLSSNVTADEDRDREGDEQQVAEVWDGAAQWRPTNVSNQALDAAIHEIARSQGDDSDGDLLAALGEFFDDQDE